MVVKAQAPSVAITPSANMSVCPGSTVNVSAAVANAFAGTTSYTISTVPYSPYTILAGTSLTMPDDTVLGPFPIGFQFCFLGNTYTQFYVGSNGWVGFSPGQTRAFTANTIPNTTTFVPRNCIMGPWMDFNPGIAGGPYIKYQTQGIAPYRRLVVQWTNVPLYQCIASKATFQIVLFESTNVIENYIANKPTCMVWAGGTATQGLHNQTGTVAFAVPGRNASVWTATNDGKRYKPSGAPSYTINWTNNGIPMGTGATASAVVNGPGNAQIISRVNFQCSNLVVYDTLVVSVGGAASAAFSVPPSICAGQAANFTYTGGAAGTGAWTFASGSPASASGTGTVSTTWASPGTYNVGLTVTPSSGSCLPGTSTQAVTVVAPPTSTFTMPATICMGSSATLTYTGTAPAGSTYSWNFGLDATPATASTAGPQSVAWSTTGTKTVTLTVSNGTCSSTTTNTIIVTSAPTSTFTLSPATLCIGSSSTITYTGTAPAGATYIWNFGAGATPSTANTAGPHTVSWSTPGNKNITLIVASGGCSSPVTTQVATVNALPTAAFSLPATVCAGSNASIVYSGTAGAPPLATYTWNIGTGSPAPGNVQGPFGVSWASVGPQSVTLSVSQGGCTSVPVSHSINVLPLPTVGIAASASTICSGQSTSFSTTGATQPAGTTYSWNFGVGATPATSTSAGPVSVSWSAVLSPSASLIVTSGGCSSAPATAAISVISPPISTISAPASACLNVGATISAPGPFAAGSTFNWNFGTGTVISGSGAGPYSVSWASTGLKTITLTVTSGSCSSTSTATVDIRSASTASFSVPSTLCEGQTASIAFTGSASGAATYSWNFGTGATPATANTAGPHSVFWANAGSKTITLTLTDGTCSIPVASQTVTVNPVYTSTFSLPTSACTGIARNVTYTGNATAGATYAWDFGAGASPATASTVGPHSVNWGTAGSSTVALTVSAAGCSSTTSNVVPVTASPTAAFSMVSSIGLGTATSISISGAVDAGATYDWVFGAGATPSIATGAGPHSVSWSTTGIKTVTLLVSKNGCSTTVNQTITVVTTATSTFTLPSSICVGDAVTATYTGNATSLANFLWNFDGGIASPGTGAGPHSITWASPGVKTVHLVVTQNGIPSADYTQNITVNAIPTATYSMPSSVCVGSAAAITYTGNAGATASYAWDFGSSASPASASTVGPHSISWSSAGTPSLSLIVTENGCSSVASVQTITVNAPPVVAFTAPSPVCVGAASIITLSSVANASVTYNWNFGLGASPATATGAGPHSVTWSSAGSKTVSLTASQNGCTSNPVNATVVVNSAPNAAFNLSTPSCVNEAVVATYTGGAAGSATYNWTYTGATLLSGSGAGPLNLSWASAGNASVQLVVTENGCASAAVSHTTVIQAAPSFTVSSPAYTAENASTTISYSGTPIAGASYTWNFNGATVISGSGVGPYQLSWANAGIYTVSCTVSINGCSAVTETSTTEVVSSALANFTVESPLCPNQAGTVTFTGFALPSASFSWNFDGGTIISGSGPGPFEISWATPGVKNVTLQINQLGVNSAVVTQPVTVYPTPTATFTSADAFCAGSDITFHYTGSASSTASYNWNFGNGTLQSSTAGMDYIVHFPAVATENISLIVSENGCVSAPFSLSVPLQAQPSANFTATSTVCENQAVSIQYTGGASATSTFSWDFDGATLLSGAGAGPIQVSFANAGSYSLSLVVKNGGCPSDTVFVPVTVNPIPSTNFSITSSGCSADSVLITYTGNASSNATYVWDLESASGFTGSNQGPYMAVFPGAGTYQIGLSIIENGCISGNGVNSVVLNESPVAAFTLVDTVYINQSATVQFTGQAPIGTAMNWLYPSANYISGGAGGPIQLDWSTPGTYAVSLSMDNVGCADGPVSQDIVVLPLPASAFTLSHDSICAGSSVIINYAGTGSTQATYNWDFDGGTIVSGSGFGPYEITWPGEGTYTVGLSITIDGITTPVSHHYVTVIAIPVASFTMPDQVCAGSSVVASYTAVTTLNALFQWSTDGADVFNDSDPANVQLTWNTPGVKNVVLSIADAMCISSPVAQSITVNEMPQAAFTLPSVVCRDADFAVAYTAPVIPTASYTWNFGSASVVSGSNQGPYTMHISSAGNAAITLQVSANGCTSTLADSILFVRDLPVADAGSDRLLCSGDTIQLSAVQHVGYSYNWSPIGGLNEDTIADPELTLMALHNFVETIDYTFTVHDGYCSASDAVTVSIAPKPEASFIHPMEECLEGNSFDFIPDGSFAPEATFTWDMGLHGFTHNPGEQHQNNIVFDASGTFPVSLQISQFGCVSDLYVDSITVNPNPTVDFIARNIKGCVPLTSTFEGISSAGADASFAWSFGDGSSDMGDSLSHSYTSSGYMSVTVIATDQHGCSATYTEQNAVQVLEQPVAGFRASPDVVFIGGDELELTSMSENALYCYYVIGADTILGCTNTYNFTESGVYPITQVVVNSLGCTDEITHTVTVEYGTEYYVPSAFTPNNDGKNDEFKIVGSEVKHFSLIIFDRWGNEIFTADDINKGWDGIASENRPMAEGVYTYRLEMRSKTNRDIVKTGAVTLLR
ncbi:MAG: hypothetical protein RLZZ543_435 [Bacteroidota bacterium]